MRLLKYGLYVVGCILLLFAGFEFLRRQVGGFAGSYPFVETWEIQASEEQVLAAIRALSKIDPSFQAPGRDVIESRDSLDMQAYWTHLHLYYTDTQEHVQAWTRAKDGGRVTTVALVSLRDAAGTRLIHRDYGYWENKKEVRRFESVVVRQIKEQLKR